MNRKTTITLITLAAAAAVVPGSALTASAMHQAARTATSTAHIVTGTLKSYSARHTAVIKTAHGSVTVNLTSGTKLVKADKLVTATPVAGNDVAAWTHGSGNTLTANKLKYGVSPFAVSSKVFRGKLHGHSAHKLSVNSKTAGVQSFRTTMQTKYVMRGQRLAHPHFVAKEPLKVTQVSLTNGVTEAGTVSLDDTGNLPNANDGQWVVGTISAYTAGTSVVITTAAGDVTVPLDANTQLVDASGGSNAPATGDNAAALLSSQDGPGDGNGDGGNGGGDGSGDAAVHPNDGGGGGCGGDGNVGPNDGGGDCGNQVAALLQFDTVPFAYASQDAQGQLTAFTSTSLTLDNGDNGGGGDGASVGPNDGGGDNSGPVTVTLDSNTQYFQDDQPVTNPTFTVGDDIEATANVSTDGSLLATVVNLPDGSDNGGGGGD